jgi:hypothetical protein
MSIPAYMNEKLSSLPLVFLCVNPTVKWSPSHRGQDVERHRSSGSAVGRVAGAERPFVAVPTMRPALDRHVVSRSGATITAEAAAGPWAGRIDS